MATLLLKPIKRQTLKVTTRKGVPINVSLLPGDQLRLQPKGSRKYIDVSLAHCYNMGIILAAKDHDDKRIKEYNRKKDLGYKGLKKPKPSKYPYSTIYFEAIKLGT